MAAHRLIAKMPTIASMAYKYSVGQPMMYPRNDLEYVANFMHMMFAVPCEPYKIIPAGVRASVHNTNTRAVPCCTCPRVSPINFVPRSSNTTVPSAPNVSVAVMHVVIPLRGVVHRRAIPA